MKLSKKQTVYTRSGQEITVNLNLRIPFGKHTRLIIQIGIDDVIVDESHTERFDT